MVYSLFVSLFFRERPKKDALFLPYFKIGTDTGDFFDRSAQLKKKVSCKPCTDTIDLKKKAWLEETRNMSQTIPQNVSQI